MNVRDLEIWECLTNKCYWSAYNKTFLKELSFELNILSNQTGQVKVEIDELVAQKENVYKFTLQNIEGTRATKTQSFSNTKNSRKRTKMHENACKIIGNEELKWVRIKDYGGRLFVADTIDLNYKELQNCKKQIEKIESIWIGLQFWSSFDPFFP